VLAYLSEALPPTAFFCVFPAKTGGLFHGLKMRELGVRPGFPNLLVLHGGRAFCIELKADAHLLEPAQRDCYAALQDARVPTVVARSLADVQHFLCVDCALPMRSWRSAA
jgi:hypothetical protein